MFIPLKMVFIGIDPYPHSPPNNIVTVKQKVSMSFSWPRLMGEAEPSSSALAL
jgi:hypothetical protein